MRYLFRGLIRETGKPVVGHVEADTEETAFNALADNGIVTESLNPDPKPNAGSPLAQRPARYSDALDSAFDASASQVAFDDLTERYRGKRVWVIDRDKIRKRVSQVVDTAISEAQSQFDNDTQTRDRVAKAIEGLFKDSKNITSPVPVPEDGPPVPPKPKAIAAPAGDGGATSPALETQVDRLASLITTAETVLAQIQAAARNASFGRGGGGGGGGEGGGGGRRRTRERKVRMTDNDVLLEIFKSNMQLQRGTAPAPAPVAVADADAGSEPVADAADEVEEPTSTEAVASSDESESREDKA